MTKTGYKLHYFDVRGRAEIIRWILHYSGQDFEDVRIPNLDAWKTEKPKTLFGQVPYLEVEQNGKTEIIGQTHAIARYLARQYGLVGKDALEEAHVDGIVDYVNDAKKPFYDWIKAIKTSDPKAETLRTDYLATGVVPFLQKLEALLEKSQNGQPGFFVGKQLTWADLTAVTFLDELVRLDPTVLTPYPALQSLTKRIHEQKGIKEWLAKRADTKF